MKAPPPLSSELEALLVPHRAVVPLAPSVEARAVARAAAAAPEPRAGRMSGRPWWLFAVAAGVVLAGGAAAYAARAWIGALVTRGPVHVAPVARPRASEPRQYIPVGSEIDAPVTIAPHAATHARRIIARTSAAAVPTNAELQLLRAAHDDVTRGDFAGALAVIAEHIRRFRNGILVEEREALRVKSLDGLGRHEDAQRAAAAFHARFPHSVFLSTFERMQEADR